ncbi:hypothetical protein [Bordetella genomosp. 1]|uniref:hypothetical protein n=1 Tax=Bordetella genomosp. 1 TaxID=1395607 RepID=UPI001140B0A1|nr:hypothetical protein [Bordetella genomosp. 1]
MSRAKPYRDPAQPPNPAAPAAVLPLAAREALQRAASEPNPKKRADLVDMTVARLRREYPQFFRSTYPSL